MCALCLLLTSCEAQLLLPTSRRMSRAHPSEVSLGRDPSSGGVSLWDSRVALDAASKLCSGSSRASGNHVVH